MKIKKLLALISVLILYCGSSAHSYACDPVPTASPSATASPVASETPWLSIQLWKNTHTKCFIDLLD